MRELHEYGVEAFVHDPHAAPEDALHEYGVRLVRWDDLPVADATILAVAHRGLVALPPEAFAAKTVKGGCIIDVKAALDAEPLRQAGLRVWRL